jgi:hypothetical protein
VPGLHVLVELKSILRLQLFLHDLVYCVLEVLSWYTFHETAGTAVVLHEDSLALVYALLLIKVVFIVVDPLSALVTLSWPLPREVLAIRFRLSLVVGGDEFGPELFAHDLLDGHRYLLRGVGVVRLRLPE